MRSFFVLLVFLGAILLTGCTFPFEIVGSGKVVTVEKDLTGFSKVAVGNAFTADIAAADEFSVVLNVDDNLVEHLRVTKDGDWLRINLEPGFSLRGHNTLRATITLPELTGLNVSGASHATITGFKSANEIVAEVSGASSLKGDLESGNGRFVVSGASSLDLDGKGRDVKLRVTGASKADLSRFSAADVDVDLSGASHVTVNAEGRLDASASGASKLYYVGSPTMGRINTSGASTIERK